MAKKKKKKHICAQCGESFNHGLGLRKHQRATKCEGSRIVEEGSEEEAAALAAAGGGAPAEEAAPPPKKRASRSRKPAPEVEADEEENEATVAVNERLDASEQTVAVPRPGTKRSKAPTAAHSAPVLEESQDGTSRFQHNRQKLSLVSRGLRILFAYRARSAGHQIKQSAVSGVNIFTEALKLAAALICLIGIPTLVFFWWNSHRKAQIQAPPPPTSFTFEDGPLAARSALLRYLDNVGKRNWNEAFGLLSNSWQKELGPAEFQNSFLDITDVRWAVNDQKLLPNGMAEVSVVLAFREAGQAQRFLGRFRLVQEGDNWKIDRAELSAEGDR